MFIRTSHAIQQEKKHTKKQNERVFFYDGINAILLYVTIVFVILFSFICL